MKQFSGVWLAFLILAATAVALADAKPAASSAPARPAASQSPSPSATARTPEPSPTPTPPILLGAPDLSADQIMINAEKATRNHDKPRFITYQMHEIFVHHWQREVYDYRVWYRADGKGLMQNLNKNRWGQTETYFGYPFPSSPDNDILLYATPDPQSTPPPPSSPVPLPSGASPPPIISHEPVVGDRYYSVKLAGVEDYHGKPVYHLLLKPIRDERAHPWKELWVDTTTFDVWKAHAHASGSKGVAQGTLDAVVEFERVGNYWLVSNAVGDGELHMGPLGDSGHYEYTFSDFGFPQSVPDWYFDAKAFKNHH